MKKILKKIKATEFSMKIREKFFLRYSYSTNAHLVQAMKRYKQCENLKSPSQIKREIEICRKYWKCYPYHYYIYDLFRADNVVTEKELINYIPHFYWYYLFLQHYSSTNFSLIGENKIIIGYLFKALTISQPKTLGIFLNGNLYSSTMNQVSCNQILNEIKLLNTEKIFVKPGRWSRWEGDI